MAASGNAANPGRDAPRQFKTRRGFSLSYQGKTLLSTVDPQGQAERLAGVVPVLGRTLYLCPSPLYGYGLPRLLERIGDDSAILCVEQDDQLLALSAEAMGDLLQENSKLRLTKAEKPESLCAYVRRTWGSRRFRRLEVIRLSGGWQLAPERYETLAEVLRREIALDWSNALTLVKLGRRYLRNALRNLGLIPSTPSLDELSFGGAPALVLGAGPSLDGVLDGLTKRLKDERLSGDSRRFKIICVDTALPALKAMNIKPDLAVALESQHWNLRDFIGLGDWSVPVAMDLSALPATGETLGGRPYLFFTPWASLGIFKRLEAAGLLPEPFPPLGSVGLTAAALARRLTSGPILIGGIDFSFTIDSFHARSAPSRQERLRRQNRFLSLISGESAFRRGTFATLSKTGLPVRSDPALRGYRDLFEREFSRDPRFRDIAGSGLPLGLEIVDQEAAFDLLEGAGIEQTPAIRGKPSSRLPPSGLKPALEAFIHREREALITLRGILLGEIAPAPEALERLLDECGYLWAHFPDCAGAEGRRPPGTDLSFLKRVRAEIDPCVTIFDAVRSMIPG
ncbi:MAG: DUF115 domain-containing protein [Treponema sp.]|jgi:hypothetical protein|nr:DUF115 domain-containing protein [Treponema sp.]